MCFEWGCLHVGSENEEPVPWRFDDVILHGRQTPTRDLQEVGLLSHPSMLVVVRQSRAQWGSGGPRH